MANDLTSKDYEIIYNKTEIKLIGLFGDLKSYYNQRNRDNELLALKYIANSLIESFVSEDSNDAEDHETTISALSNLEFTNDNLRGLSLLSENTEFIFDETYPENQESVEDQVYQAVEFIEVLKQTLEEDKVKSFKYGYGEVLKLTKIISDIDNLDNKIFLKNKTLVTKKINKAKENVENIFENEDTTGRLTKKYRTEYDEKLKDGYYNNPKEVNSVKRNILNVLLQKSLENSSSDERKDYIINVGSNQPAWKKINIAIEQLNNLYSQLIDTTNLQLSVDFNTLIRDFMAQYSYNPEYEYQDPNNLGEQKQNVLNSLLQDYTFGEEEANNYNSRLAGAVHENDLKEKGHGQIYDFTSYGDSDAQTLYGQGQVEVLESVAGYTSVKVISNSEESFVGNIYHIHNVNPNAILQLFTEEDEPIDIYVKVVLAEDEVKDTYYTSEEAIEHNSQLEGAVSAGVINPDLENLVNGLDVDDEYIYTPVDKSVVIKALKDSTSQLTKANIMNKNVNNSIAKNQKTLEQNINKELIKQNAKFIEDNKNLMTEDELNEAIKKNEETYRNNIKTQIDENQKIESEPNITDTIIVTEKVEELIEVGSIRVNNSGLNEEPIIDVLINQQASLSISYTPSNQNQIRKIDDLTISNLDSSVDYSLESINELIVTPHAVGDYTFIISYDTVSINVTLRVDTEKVNITWVPGHGLDDTVQTVDKDSNISIIEDPTVDGYTFNGWFTLEDGGDQVTTDMIADTDKIFYAQWTENVEETKYWWFVGKEIPNQENSSNDKFTNEENINNGYFGWNVEGYNQIDSDILTANQWTYLSDIPNEIVVYSGTVFPASEWYIAIPTEFNYSAFGTDGLTPEGSVIKSENTLEFNGIQYDLFIQPENYKANLVFHA